MKKLKIILIVFIILGIIGAIGSSGEDNLEKTASKSKTSETQENIVEEEKIEYLVCNTDDMMDLLEKNALKAEKEYCDKYLEVTGRLSVIDSDGDYISLFPVNDEWAFTGIQCYIKNEEQLNQVLQFEIDDIVTVKIKCNEVGEVLGYTGDIIEFVN